MTSYTINVIHTHDWKQTVSEFLYIVLIFYIINYRTFFIYSFFKAGLYINFIFNFRIFSVQSLTGIKILIKLNKV